MGIQIKGINTDLVVYKTKLERKVPFSDRMIGRYHASIQKATDYFYSENRMAKVGETLNGVKAFGYGVTAAIADSLETRNRRNALMQATGLEKDAIAMDINELQALRNQGKAVKVYGGDIRYSAQIKKEWLASIETIFGNADLQALDDFSCLASLKAIYGDLNLSQVKDSKVDLSGLHLQMVYGDIHAEQAASTNGLEELLAVGGTIYYQEDSYSLDDFEKMVASNEKERQK